MTVLRLCGATLLAAALPISAQAELIAGLTNDGRIVTFDSATPTTIASSFAISGLNTGDVLFGIDRRPANGLLYAVAQTGRVYTLTTGGIAALVSTLSVTPTGSRFGFDFNPVPDRLRIISESDQNLRANVADGATITDTAITRAGGGIDIIGTAYSNNFAGTTTTTIYGIDTVSDVLVTSAAPNGGVYTNIGALGVNLTNQNVVGFDISGLTGTAYLSIDSAFYTVNLGTGAATFVNTIGSGPLIGLTAVSGAVPEPATWAMMIAGFGAIGAGLRRRRRAVTFA